MKTITDIQQETGNSERLLGRWYGVVSDYYDVSGKRHKTSSEMRRRLLESMRVLSTDPAELDARLQQAWKRWLEPVKVFQSSAQQVDVWITLPEAVSSEQVQFALVLESGQRYEGTLPAALKTIRRREVGGVHYTRSQWPLPVVPEPGYHRLELTSEVKGKTVRYTQSLIATPDACFIPDSLVAQPATPEKPAPTFNRTWGVAVQLYSVKSERNWGMGDFTDLFNMVDWISQNGGGLVGLNPLHSLFPHNPVHASPYSPSSRLFFNTLYIDVQAVAEFASCVEAQRKVLAPAFQEHLNALRRSEMVDYAGVAKAKNSILELLYQTFCEQHLTKQTYRAREFRAFQEQRAKRLRPYATYMALQEKFYKEDNNLWGWPVWPEAYQRPDSAEVKAFVSANLERIEYFEYIQWVADEQLHRAGIRALEKQLPVGLYMDLAVGVDSGSADVWMDQHLFAMTARVGAPPDALNQKGQNWGLLPWIPHELYESAYEPVIELFQANMRYAGAMRLDHVMALMRLFWIPDFPMEDPASGIGAYVKYPFEDMLGILALESHRNQCVVIGEDLGTVPEKVQVNMDKWGVLSYKVLFFEMDDHETYTSPQRYKPKSLVTLSTHDLPTIRGFWEGEDIRVRTQLDLYPEDYLREEQVRQRVIERWALLRALKQEGLLPENVSEDPSSVPMMTPELALAIQTYLSRTPCLLQAVQLEDVLNDINQKNVPGTTSEHPNWQRKLPINLEDYNRNTVLVSLCNNLNQERRLSLAPAKGTKKKISTKY